MSRVKRVIGPIVIIVCIVGLFWESLSFEPRDGLWPQGIIAALFLLCLSLLIRGAKQENVEEETDETPSGGRGKVWSAIALTVAYLFVSEWAGYYITTVFFIFTLLLVLGERSRVILSALPILTTLAIYAVFFLFLRIPLPSGIFF